MKILNNLIYILVAIFFIIILIDILTVSYKEILTIALVIDFILLFILMAIGILINDK